MLGYGSGLLSNRAPVQTTRPRPQVFPEAFRLCSEIGKIKKQQPSINFVPITNGADLASGTDSAQPAEPRHPEGALARRSSARGSPGSAGGTGRSQAPFSAAPAANFPGF